LISLILYLYPVLLLLFSVINSLKFLQHPEIGE